MPLKVFPALCFPPQQGSLSQQPGLLWFELHWWCNSLKMTRQSLLKVLLKAADYSVNLLWIIFSVFMLLYPWRTAPPKRRFSWFSPTVSALIQVEKLFKELGKTYIYIYIFLGFLSSPVFQHLFFFNHINLSIAGGGMVGFPCFDG